MFSPCDLRFVFCSRDLDVLRAQRIMGFVILITHKSTRSENAITWTECLNPLASSMTGVGGRPEIIIQGSHSLDGPWQVSNVLASLYGGHYSNNGYAQKHEPTIFLPSGVHH